MIHFHDVIEAVRTVFKDKASELPIEEVLVLRDLRGRIRLFLTPAEGRESEVEAACPSLAGALADRLRAFWGGLISIDSPKAELHDLLESVRGDREPLEPLEPGDAPPKWWIVERHAAKSAWTTHAHKPPWPLRRQTPGIVAFYSHKGGVGRTTALCAAAMNLAREREKVVVVDLDLEAPGLATLLTDTPVECGVTDFLLERLLAGKKYQPDLGEFTARQIDPALIGESGEPILCVPAGLINEHYLQKLSRLDYELIAGYEDESDNPLGELLTVIKREYNPGYIFLDCRAGLHDLGGLAVQRLSHANVIFGLDSEQSWQGLRCILRSLGLVKTPPPCLLVQAMEWPNADETRKKARDRFLRRAHEVYSDVYYEEGQVPHVDDEGEPHYPFHLPYIQTMAGYQTLRDVAEVLTREPYSAFTRHVRETVGKAVRDVRKSREEGY